MPGELLGDLVAVEAVQREPVDAGGALELGEQRAQRVAPVQLVGAVGDDEAERLLARAAHEERDEVARRAVGPVEVLDRQQHRPGAAEPLEQREHRLEQAALAGARLLVGARAGAAQLGQQLGERVAGGDRQRLGLLGREAARERAQRGDERRVGDLRAAQLEALAEQHARAARARAGLELAAAAASCRRPTRRRRTRTPAGPPAARSSAASEQLELGAAADERGRGDPARHAPIVAHARSVWSAAMVVASSAAPAVGDLLRAWRRRRGLSQLEVSLDAAVSARHLSFVETGRSRPSRELVLHLAEHFDVPLRERNALLLAAGYAPAYGETPLDAEAMAPVRAALDKVLAGHAPYPAVIVDRRWDLVSANAPALAILRRRRRAGAARAAGQHAARVPASRTASRRASSTWRSTART